MRYPETASLIRSARLRKGLSQEKAAAAVGCSRLQFIRWEQGLHKPEEHAGGLVAVLEIDKKALDEADDEDSSMPSRAESDFAAAVDALITERIDRVLRDRSAA